MTMWFHTLYYSIPNQSWLTEKNTVWFYLGHISLPTLGCLPVQLGAGLRIIRSEYILISIRSMETQSPPWPPEPSVDHGCLLKQEGKHKHRSVIEQDPFKNVSGPLFSGCIAVGGPLLRKHTYASIKNWLRWEVKLKRPSSLAASGRD